MMPWWMHLASLLRNRLSSLLWAHPGIFAFTPARILTTGSPMLLAYLTKEFSIGFGLHQLRHILWQSVIQLIFLVVCTVIHLLDLK